MTWGSNAENKGVQGPQFTLGVIDTHCTTFDENSQLEKQGYKMNTTRFIPYNVTNSYNSSPAKVTWVGQAILQRPLHLVHLSAAGPAEFE